MNGKKETHHRILVALLVAAAVTWTRSAIAGEPAPTFRLVTHEISLGDTIPRDYVSNMAISPDSRHVAYDRVVVSQRAAVIYDGVEGKPYGNILKGSLVFSPDSQRFGYIARDGGKDFVVINNKEGLPYNSVTNLTFSADSQRVAYVVTRGELLFANEIVIVDGKEGKEYAAIEGRRVQFSPDNKRVAYVARTAEKKSVVVIDEKESKPFDAVVPGSVTFSPDSQRVAFIGVQNGKAAMVVDGEVQAPAEKFGGPWFSPDSKHIIYQVLRRGKMSLVMDGKEGPAYDEILGGKPIFSPDSRRLAYGARRGRTLVAVIDGVEGPETSGLSLIAFSPDSQRVMYFIEKTYLKSRSRRGPGGGVEYSSEHKQLAILDGIEGRPYDRAGFGMTQSAFSPDGDRIIYTAARDGKQFIVVNGKEGLQYDALLPGTPFYSPDNKQMIYVALKDKQWVIIVDGEEQARHEGIAPGSFAFSPDNRHLAYLVTGGGSMKIAVDGLESSSTYDGFFPGSKLVFDDATHLHTQAVRQRDRETQIYRVDMEIVPE